MQFLMVILLSLSIISSALAQKSDFKLMHTIEVKAAEMRVDHLNNIYARTSDYELTKYSQQGKKIATFSQTKNGPLTFVDPGNPMNVLAFYQDYQNIILLDISLSPLLNFNLNRLGFIDVPLVANSRDDLFWIFDNADGRLKKLDRNGNVVHSSINLASDLGIKDPTYLLARNNYVFLSDTTKGIYVFDNFGQFYRKFPIQDIYKLQFSQNQLLYYQNQQLHAINIKTMERFKIQVPGKKVIWCVWQKPLLFVHEPNAIKVYRLME